MAELPCNQSPLLPDGDRVSSSSDVEAAHAHGRPSASRAFARRESVLSGGEDPCGRRSVDAFYAEVVGGSPVELVAVNLSNAIIGAGIIGLPFALREAGFSFGMLLLTAMAGVSRFSLTTLVNAGIGLRCRSYEATAERALGSAGETAVLASQFAFDFGAMLSYLIIAAETSSAVVELLLGYRLAGQRQLCLLALSFGAMLPICLMRDISGLEAYSSVSVIVVLVVTAMVVAKTAAKYSRGEAGDQGPLDYWPSHGVEGIIFAVGVFSFAFVNQNCCFLYYNSLDRGTPARFGRVASLSVVGAWALCAGMAAAGYLNFRRGTEANVLSNFRDDDALATVMRVLYVVTMVLTYPVCLFVCRQVLHNLLTPRGAGGALCDVRDVSDARHAAYTAAIFLASVAIVSITDNLGVVMSVRRQGGGRGTGGH